MILREQVLLAMQALRLTCQVAVMPSRASPPHSI